MNIRYFDTLESTNNYCKLLDLNTVEEFTVICAGKQTAGIGQQGNVWNSEPYKNLTFSIILKPTFLSTADQYQLTMMLAVAVAKTTMELLPHHPVKIKWPNDIYVSDRKICGILTTATVNHQHIDSAICGIGFNVNQTVFPAWIPNPTSIALQTGQEHDLGLILQLLLKNIENEYLLLRNNPDVLKEQYLKSMYRRGVPSQFKLNEDIFIGTIEGVDRFGHLIINPGKRSFDLKEVQFVI